MILTGKAKENFIEWYYKNYLSSCNFLSKYEPYDLYDALHDVMKNALIIEWFDSVGIYIQIDCGNLKHDNTNNIYFQGGVLKNEFGSVFNTRKEATEEAIKKANEIYNNNN